MPSDLDRAQSRLGSAAACIEQLCEIINRLTDGPCNQKSHANWRTEFPQYQDARYFAIKALDRYECARVASIGKAFRMKKKALG